MELCPILHIGWARFRPNPAELNPWHSQGRSHYPHPIMLISPYHQRRSRESYDGRARSSSASRSLDIVHIVCWLLHGTDSPETHYLETHTAWEGRVNALHNIASADLTPMRINASYHKFKFLPIDWHFMMWEGIFVKYSKVFDIFCLINAIQVRWTFKWNKCECQTTIVSCNLAFME